MHKLTGSARRSVMIARHHRLSVRVAGRRHGMHLIARRRLFADRHRVKDRHHRRVLANRQMRLT